MNRKHAATISVLLAGAVAAGAFAITRDPASDSSPARTRASDALVARRTAELDALEAALASQAAQAPPLSGSVQTSSSGPSSRADDDGQDDDHHDDDGGEWHDD